MAQHLQFDERDKRALHALDGRLRQSPPTASVL